MSTVSVYSHLCYTSLIKKFTRNVNGLYGTLPLLTFILHDSWSWVVWHGLKPGPAGWLPGLGASVKHDPVQHFPAGPELGLKYGPGRCEPMSHFIKKLLTYYLIIVNLLF